MTRDEADRVMNRLSAGFPHVEWADETSDQWQERLEPLGFKEALAAADAVIENHEFLTVAAFFKQLARVRELHLDQQRSRFANQPALAESSVSAPADARAHVAVLKEALLALEWRDRAMLADLPNRRYDEEWFAQHPGLPGQPNGRRGRKPRRKRR